MKKFNILFTDYEFKTLEPEEKVLKEAIPEVQLHYAQCKTEEEVIEAAKGMDALINQYAPITDKVIETLYECKVIARYGVGVNTIDLESATKHNIVVSNVTDYCDDEVSDHAFALLLNTARKISLLDQDIQKGGWDFKQSIPIYRLRGRTLGLIGFGKIPQVLALKAKAFGLKVIAYDPYASEERARDKSVTLMDLNELCEQADFISVHAPLTKETTDLIGEEQFQLMKPTATIINTARGPIINEESLIKALQENEISGAGLDVLTDEPASKDNPLRRMPQVVLTPHSAWYSEEAQLDLKQKTAQNIADVLLGYRPKYIFPINEPAYSHLTVH